MNIARNILNRFNVFVVIYVDMRNYTVILARSEYSRGHTVVSEIVGQADPADYSKVPAIILIGGYGVITKKRHVAGEIMEKIAPSREDFLCSGSPENGVSFVRRGQIQEVLGRFKDAGIRVILTECLPALRDDSVQDTVREYMQRFYDERIVFKQMLKPSEQNSSLLRMVAERIKIPCLGLVLLVLMANFFVGREIVGKYQGRRAEIIALQRKVNTFADRDRSRRKVSEHFHSTLPYRYAWMCDRMAAVLPDNTLLTYMAVNPLVKALEDGKSPALNDRRLVVHGQASRAEYIYEYAERLRKEKFAARLDLSTVEKDAEHGCFVFRIKISL